MRSHLRLRKEQRGDLLEGDGHLIEGWGFGIREASPLMRKEEEADLARYRASLKYDQAADRELVLTPKRQASKAREQERRLASQRDLDGARLARERLCRSAKAVLVERRRRLGRVVDEVEIEQRVHAASSAKLRALLNEEVELFWATR